MPVVSGVLGEYLYDSFAEPSNITTKYIQTIEVPAIHIDDHAAGQGVAIDAHDPNGIIKIVQPASTSHPYIICEDDAGEEEFKIDHNGTVTVKDLSVSGSGFINSTWLQDNLNDRPTETAMTFAITDTIQVSTANIYPRLDGHDTSIASNLVKITSSETAIALNSTNVAANLVKNTNNAASAAQNTTNVAANLVKINLNISDIAGTLQDLGNVSTLALANETNLATHTTTSTAAITGNTNNITTLTGQIDAASHLHSNATVGSLIERHDDMHFENIHADNVSSSVFETQGEVVLEDEAQLIFYPYIDDGSGSMALDATGKYRFGRSDQVGQDIGTEDGLSMSRFIQGYQHSMVLSIHPAVANITINSTKNSDQPYLLCTGSGSNDPRFAINADGSIVSAGVHTSDFSSLPDAFHGSSVHNSSSVYIGRAKLSYDKTGNCIHTHVLKDNSVPHRLKSAPYNLTTSSIPSGETQITVHEWMELARESHTPLKTSLRVSEIFQEANLAADFNHQILDTMRADNIRVGASSNHNRYFEVDDTGAILSANTTNCKDLVVEDRIDSVRHWMQSDTASDQLMFVLQNQNGERVFSIDNDGYIRDSPQEELVVEDASLYIGSAKISFKRSTGELKLKRLKASPHIPLYLQGRGHTNSAK